MSESGGDVGGAASEAAHLGLWDAKETNVFQSSSSDTEAVAGDPLSSHRGCT